MPSKNVTFAIKYLYFFNTQSPNDRGNDDFLLQMLHHIMQLADKYVQERRKEYHPAYTICYL